MPNQVEVLADDMGNVVRLSKNNPEYSHIRLGYKSISIGKGGWLYRCSMLCRRTTYL